MGHGEIVKASWSLVLAALLPAAPASGDAVRLTSGIVWDAVNVTDVADGKIKFRIDRRELSKPLGDVAAVKLAGEKTFNRAEKLFGERKYNEAAAAYEGAARMTRVAWKKALIGYRRMRALEAGGAIDAALKQWLAISDASGGSKGVLGLRPRKLPPRGSRANERAIGLLREKAGKLTDQAYRRAVLQALVDLYERQGRLAEAQALQAQLAGRSFTRPAGRRGTPPARSAGARLRLAELSLKQGRYVKAIEQIQPNLRRYRSEDLPSALYLLGQAQLNLAASRLEKDQKAARKLLLEAGLNLMRSVVFFPGSAEAPRALLSAGRVNELLGNFTAARAAYSTVMSGSSRSPAAAKAKKALQRIRNK